MTTVTTTRKVWLLTLRTTRDASSRRPFPWWGPRC